MRAHVVRDNTGAIISGSVDFIVDYTLPAATNIVGLHIHRGAAGTNGPVLINTGIAGASVVAAGTTGRVARTAEVLASDAAGVLALNDLFADPSQFYVNLHTTEYPGGIFRSQLTKATLVTTAGLMDASQRSAREHQRGHRHQLRYGRHLSQQRRHHRQCPGQLRHQIHLEERRNVHWLSHSSGQRGHQRTGR